MNIIAVDDEPLALEISELAIKAALPGCTLSCFTSTKKALAYAKENQVDIAFLDVEMGGMNGIMLAKNLKDIYNKTNIIIVTGYLEYAYDSYSVKASEFILKPLTKEAVMDSIENLRNPVKIECDKRVRIQTFGNFEIFVDEQPLVFARDKTKELLAYLVDRKGAICNNNEIIAVIWENRIDTPALKSHFRNLVSDLTQTLKAKGVEDIIVKNRGCLGILFDKISCDAYDFSHTSPQALNSYMGEYMKQFTWAELTNGFLADIK